MIDMIERVAKAFDPDAWRDWSAEPPIVRARADLRRDVSLRKADAALRAMRDPSPLELYPGVHAYIEVETTCRPVAFRAGWNAVIDAALSKANHSTPTDGEQAA